MADLERRIADALAGLPDADEVRARAVSRAGAAVPGRARRLRRRAWVAAGLGVAAAATVGIAATQRGALREHVGSVSPGALSPLALRPPLGAHGIAVLLGDRLYLNVRGVSIDRLPATAADLSPNARYVAIGRPGQLVALSPAGTRRMWTLPVSGVVTRVAWSPNPIHVAFVVQRGARRDLWLVEGDGDHPRRVASVDASPVAWNAAGTAVHARQPSGVPVDVNADDGTVRRGSRCATCGAASSGGVRVLARVRWADGQVIAATDPDWVTVAFVRPVRDGSHPLMRLAQAPGRTPTAQIAVR